MLTMERLGAVYVNRSEHRRLTGLKSSDYEIKNKKRIGLKSSDGKIKIATNNRYEHLLRSFPDNVRVPDALIKIGVIAGDIQIDRHDIRVIRVQEKIVETPTTDLSSKMLSEFRRYMSKLHKNRDLSEPDKKCIGTIINVSDLGSHPKNAGEFKTKISGKKQYQGIRIESHGDKFNLDERKSISRKNPNGTGGAFPSKEEFRKHREAVQDDVELDKI